MRTYYFHPTVISKRKRNKTVTRRATVAAVQDLDGEGNIVFRFGLSVCSHKDRFVKQYGRATAIGRALNPPPKESDMTIIIPYNGEASKRLTAAFLEFACELLESRGFTIVPKPKKEKHENVQQ